jgi:spermidine synthase
MQRREFLGACGLAALSFGCQTRASTRAPAPQANVEPEPAATAGEPPERVIDEGRSEFNHVIVTQQGTLRKMYFETDGLWRLQSTYDLATPEALHHEVFQTMVSALLIMPAPRRMCMIGVGGGQLSNYLFRHLPKLELDVVDICPEVIRLARAHFGVPDDPRYRLHVGDGRVFVESLAPASVDLLVHDAYRGHSIPKHLRSQEFFAACAERLTPAGVVVANMHRRTPRYPIDRATMASVFRHAYRFASVDDIQTTVVSSMAEQALTPAQLRANAAELQPGFDFDLVGLAGRCLIDEEGWDLEAVVHDDFDPGELDEAARRHNLSCAPRCDGDR